MIDLQVQHRIVVTRQQVVAGPAGVRVAAPGRESHAGRHVAAQTRSVAAALCTGARCALLFGRRSVLPAGEHAPWMQPCAGWFARYPQLNNTLLQHLLMQTTSSANTIAWKANQHTKKNQTEDGGTTQAGRREHAAETRCRSKPTLVAKHLASNQRQRSS